MEEIRPSRRSTIFTTFPFSSLPVESPKSFNTVHYDVECALPEVNVSLPVNIHSKLGKYSRWILGSLLVIGLFGCLSISIYYTIRSISNETIHMQSSYSNLHGICYSPFHNRRYGSAEFMESVIDEDFLQIKNNFSLIRTYYSNYMGINIAAKAAQYDLQLALGVMMTVNNAPYAYLENEIEAAIIAGNNYTQSIHTIFVGNENLKPTETSTWGSSSAYDILAIMNRLRSNITSPNIKIGTVQRINEWLIDNEEVNMLANASDIIGVNIYPFFTTDGGVDEIAILEAQWNQMKQRFPDNFHKIRLTETGWPTNGSSYGNNVPNLKNATTYYYAVQQWIEQKGIEAYYFKYFDERTPTLAPNDYEQFFGLADVDGNYKFVDQEVVSITPTFSTSSVQTNSSNTSSTSWYCMINGVARKENCENYNAMISSSKDILCCSNMNGESCDILHALSWENCNILQLENIFTISSETNVNATWECAERINGEIKYSNDSCKSGDMNAFISSNQMGCFSNDIPMPWTSCNFSELENLVQDSVLRMKTQNQAIVKVAIQQKPLEMNFSIQSTFSMTALTFGLILFFMKF